MAIVKCGAAFDYSKLQAGANALHMKAKNGTLKLNGQLFTFSFDSREGVYVVTDQAGTTVMRYNTRKLATARKWLRDYFRN